MRELLTRPEGTYEYVDPNKVRYNVVSAQERLTLAMDLLAVTDAILVALPEDRSHLWNQAESLRDSIFRLTSSAEESLCCNITGLQQKLDELPELLNIIYLHATLPARDAWMERQRAREVKKFVKKLNNITAPLGPVTFMHFTYDQTKDYPVTFDFSLFDERTAPYLTQRLQANANPEKAAEDKFMGDTATIQETSEWLGSISSDVLDAYTATQELIREVVPLLQDAEDEYFVEQIAKDYYPHIFESLKTFNGENSDFWDKEAVVKENLKQFKIIQLGLQKIIDRAVARHVNAVRSQTDFLRNKVLRENGLSLTDSEADDLVETSVEETNRVREELYKKHVAPVLKKNKEEYEELLSATKARFAKEIVEKDKTYHANLASEKTKYVRHVGEIKARHRKELEERDAYFRQRMNNVRSQLDEAIAALQNIDSQHKAEVARLSRTIVSLREKLNKYEAKSDTEDSSYHKLVKQLESLERRLQRDKEKLTMLNDWRYPSGGASRSLDVKESELVEVELAKVQNQIQAASKKVKDLRLKVEQHEQNVVNLTLSSNEENKCIANMSKLDKEHLSDLDRRLRSATKRYNDLADSLDKARNRGYSREIQDDIAKELVDSRNYVEKLKATRQSLLLKYKNQGLANQEEKLLKRSMLEQQDKWISLKSEVREVRRGKVSFQEDEEEDYAW